MNGEQLLISMITLKNCLTIFFFSYSDLEAWVFEDDAQFLDQIATLIPSTISSSVVTLVCMTVVCIIFMYNLFTVCVATFSIMSVCIGVFGFLAMWGIDLVGEIIFWYTVIF